jgi:hypothetical protein
MHAASETTSPRRMGGGKLPQVEVHFNVDQKLFKRFERALLKSGFSTKSEFFRSKMRELVAKTEGGCS